MSRTDSKRIKRTCIEYRITVTQTRLNGSEYAATVALTIDLAIKIPIDTIVPIAIAYGATFSFPHSIAGKDKA